MTSQNQALMWTGLPQHLLTVWNVVTECYHLKLQSSGTWHIYTYYGRWVLCYGRTYCLHCWHVLHTVPTDFWNMIIPDYQTTNHQGTLKTEGWGSSCTLVFIYQRDRSASIAICYGLDSPGIKSRWGWDFPLPIQTIPGTHSAPIQWVLGYLLGGTAARAWRYPTHLQT
jgi:hypothetical protein